MNILLSQRPPCWRPTLFIATTAILFITACSIEAAQQPGISIDDLTRRAEIPLAQMSPDGIFAAYLLVRGNPTEDVYEVTMRVTNVLRRSTPITIGEYKARPEDTYHSNGEYLLTAGDFQWISRDALLFTTRSGTSMRLSMWNVQTHKIQTLIEEDYDQIVIEPKNERQDRITVTTTTFTNPPKSELRVPPDQSWRLRDGYRFFYSDYKNPKLGRWAVRQRWSLSINGKPGLHRDGERLESWEHIPMERELPASGADALVSYREVQKISTADGSRTAAVQYAHSPEGISFRILLDGVLKIAIPANDQAVMVSLLGWNSTNDAVYVLTLSSRASALKLLDIDGVVTTILNTQTELSRPCLVGRTCTLVSANDRFALLRQSTNVVPAELVVIDLQSRAISTLDSPNQEFSRVPQPSIRFYAIENLDGSAWGRLYLPFDYRRGQSIPLVVTQYNSTPGFAAAVGDEIPILPLTASGIAVFAMHSGALNFAPSGGDFNVELARVQRPLLGMQWIVARLSAEGIIDANKVGVSGLSYGAEIAMYAYWKWSNPRAVSVASVGWSPAHYLLAGPNYSRYMDGRFPALDEAGIIRWRELSAGLNARTNLPPLLIQSSDRETIWSVPNWTLFRRAGAPVDFLEYPGDGHIKRHPANKWWVYCRNLDWFRFWLQDYEDPSPQKAEQYTRWRAMQKLDFLPGGISLR